MEPLDGNSLLPFRNSIVKVSANSVFSNSGPVVRLLTDKELMNSYQFMGKGELQTVVRVYSASAS